MSLSPEPTAASSAKPVHLWRKCRSISFSQEEETVIKISHPQECMFHTNIVSEIKKSLIYAEQQIWTVLYARPQLLIPPSCPWTPRPPPPSADAYIHLRGARHYLMPVLWPAVVLPPWLGSIGMGKKNGELNGQNCEVVWGWQVARWLTHIGQLSRHTVFFIHSPCPFLSERDPIGPRRWM